MKCPRCEFEYQELINGQLVKVDMEVCIMCAFPIYSNYELVDIVDHCVGASRDYLLRYESSRNQKDLEKAHEYLSVAINELDDDILPIRPEVSG